MTQKPFIVPEHIKTFCKKLYQDMNKHNWYDISIYDLIAISDFDLNDDDQVSRDTASDCKSLIKILSKILTKPKKGK